MSGLDVVADVMECDVDDVAKMVSDWPDEKIEAVVDRLQKLLEDNKIRQQMKVLKEHEKSGGEVFSGTFYDYLCKVYKEPIHVREKDPYVREIERESFEDITNITVHSVFDDHYVYLGSFTIDGGMHDDPDWSEEERDWILPS